MATPDLTRRAFGGAALLGVSAPVLASCGAQGTEAHPVVDGPPVATADVPVGGGVVLPDAELVVTQPTEGRFEGFSAVCTHKGCIVAGVEDREIVCPCHGSRFSIEDGRVVGGPAPDPLPRIPLKVKGEQISPR